MNNLLKAVVWQLFCLAYSTISSYLIFGNLEVPAFSVFLCTSLLPILYIYDKLWDRNKK